MPNSVEVGRFSDQELVGAVSGMLDSRLKDLDPELLRKYERSTPQGKLRINSALAQDFVNSDVMAGAYAVRARGILVLNERIYIFPRRLKVTAAGFKYFDPRLHTIWMDYPEEVMNELLVSPLRNIVKSFASKSPRDVLLTMREDIILPR